jgi:uncharacterized repeat protein (TIGR03803 family)
MRCGRAQEKNIQEEIMQMRKMPVCQSVVVLLLTLGAVVGAASAQTETVMYNFCSQSGCVDGYNPDSSVTLDAKGNIYGTAFEGGSTNFGLVYQLSAQGNERVLNFNGPNGAYPESNLVLGVRSGFFGTTGGGGTYDGGTVFKVTASGEEAVLYNFCSKPLCTDGYLPVAGLVHDAIGNLYGITYYGGASNKGTVFEVTLSGEEKVLYSFCALSGCADGYYPTAGLTIDKSGNLYGTTHWGGSNGAGVVFMVSPSGNEATLYNFCSQAYCTDGGEPQGSMVFDTNGNLYGTTNGGGAHGGGTVFMLTPSTDETVLYNFCSQSGCVDGIGPVAGVVLDKRGNLYGTTSAGGAGEFADGGGGTVFKLKPTGEETVLYNFCSQTGCADGRSPSAAVVFDRSGNLYGTTYSGGASSGCYIYGCGVVFKLAP